MSPDGEIRGELVLCRRPGGHMLASVEKMFVRLKPSPLGRAPADLPSLPAAVPDCTRGLWPWAAFPGRGAAQQLSKASLEEAAPKSRSCE